VQTLRGIITHNGLDVVDDTVFRDEPMRFLVVAEAPENAARLRAEIEAARASGELDAIISRMNLE
jgi:hypothetical protein